MYCKSCGNQIDDKAVACLNCGADPRKKGKFCGNCGSAVHENAVVCVSCGQSLVPNKNIGGSNSDLSDTNSTEGQGMAITSLILSIIAIGSSWAYGIPGIIFGLVGMILGGIAKKNKKLTIAKVGFVLGLIALILSVIALVLWILYWVWIDKQIHRINKIYNYTNGYYY